MDRRRQKRRGKKSSLKMPMFFPNAGVCKTEQGNLVEDEAQGKVGPLNEEAPGGPGGDHRQTGGKAQR